MWSIIKERSKIDNENNAHFKHPSVDESEGDTKFCVDFVIVTVSVVLIFFICCKVLCS